MAFLYVVVILKYMWSKIFFRGVLIVTICFTVHPSYAQFDFYADSLETKSLLVVDSTRLSILNTLGEHYLRNSPGNLGSTPAAGAGGGPARGAGISAPRDAIALSRTPSGREPANVSAGRRPAPICPHFSTAAQTRYPPLPRST